MVVIGHFHGCRWSELVWMVPSIYRRIFAQATTSSLRSTVVGFENLRLKLISPSIQILSTNCLVVALLVQRLSSKIKGFPLSHFKIPELSFQVGGPCKALITETKIVFFSIDFFVIWSNKIVLFINNFVAIAS